MSDRFRHISYALNFWLSPDNPHGTARWEEVPRPEATVHFVILAFQGENAANDHVHPNLWYSPIVGQTSAKAAFEVQTNAHGGVLGTWDAVSNYGFLDGHVVAARFRDRYRNPDQNVFRPTIAR